MSRAAMEGAVVAEFHVVRVNALAIQLANGDNDHLEFRMVSHG